MGMLVTKSVCVLNLVHENKFLFIAFSINDVSFIVTVAYNMNSSIKARKCELVVITFKL